jgi:hypothetical protein
MSKKNRVSSRKHVAEQNNLEIYPAVLALSEDLRKFYADMIEQHPSDPIVQKLAREGLEIVDDLSPARKPETEPA